MVVDLARERVRVGDGGAKGDEGDRWGGRLGDPVVQPRIGEPGTRCVRGV